MTHVHINGISLPEGFDSGQKTVTVANTTEALVGESVPCTRAIVSARNNNSGQVYVGSRAAMAAGDGKQLAPGSQVFIETLDLRNIYVHVESGGDGVSYSYTTRTLTLYNLFVDENGDHLVDELGNRLGE